MKTLRLAVLISGRGSNLQALIDACKKSDFPAEIAVVISNKPDAQGLARAADAGLPAMIVDHTYFKGDKDAFENALAAIAEQHGANLVCLAGFMRVLGSVFLNRFKDKVINIHPSLLPKHPGLHVHESVLKAGDKKSGCSVHVVTAGVDEGPVIASREVPVKKGDSAESLAARVLVEEHVLYPEVIKQLGLGQIVIRDGKVEKPGKMPANDMVKPGKPALKPVPKAVPNPAVESAPNLGHHGSVKKESQKATVMSHAADSHATGSHGAHPPVADAEATQRSQDIWNAFTKATLIAGGAIAVTLILMAVTIV